MRGVSRPLEEIDRRDRFAVLIMGESRPDSLAFGLILEILDVEFLTECHGGIPRLEILTDGLAIQSAGDPKGLTAGLVGERGDLESMLGQNKKSCIFESATFVYTLINTRLKWWRWRDANMIL